jgi:hypothetical protein
MSVTDFVRPDKYSVIQRGETGATTTTAPVMTGASRSTRLPKVSGLSQNGAESLSEGGLIGRRESSKFFEYKSWINGGEGWFEDGGFE